MITNKFIYLVGREVIKKGAQKGQTEEVIKRKLEYDQITSVSLRFVYLLNIIYRNIVIKITLMSKLNASEPHHLFLPELRTLITIF